MPRIVWFLQVEATQVAVFYRCCWGWLKDRHLFTARPDKTPPPSNKHESDAPIPSNPHVVLWTPQFSSFLNTHWLVVSIFMSRLEECGDGRELTFSFGRVETHHEYLDSRSLYFSGGGCTPLWIPSIILPLPLNCQLFPSLSSGKLILMWNPCLQMQSFPLGGFLNAVRGFSSFYQSQMQFLG